MSLLRTLNKIKSFSLLPVHGDWSSFYISMAGDVLLTSIQDSVRNYSEIEALDLSKPLDLGPFTPLVTSLGLTTKAELRHCIQSLQFCMEYDRAVRGGWALSTMGGKLSGEPLSKIRISAMFSVMVLLNRNGILTGNDLLTNIGPAIQAYWTGAQFQTPPVGIGKSMPTIPLPYFVSYVPFGLINGTCVFPGIWTPIPVLTTEESEYAWLFNFILSANLHLLTLSGFLVSNVVYPPPAPPAPTVVPWFGYFVPPLSIGNFQTETTRFILNKNLGSLTSNIWRIGKNTVIATVKNVLPSVKRDLQFLALDTIVTAAIPYKLEDSQKKLLIEDLQTDPEVEKLIKSGGSSGGAGATGTL